MMKVWYSKQKSICVANFGWIFACYRSGVSSNVKLCCHAHFGRVYYKKQREKINYYIYNKRGIR